MKILSKKTDSIESEIKISFHTPLKKENSSLVFNNFWIFSSVSENRQIFGQLIKNHLIKRQNTFSETLLILFLNVSKNKS